MKTKVLLAALTASTFVACSSKSVKDQTPSTATGPSIEAKQVAMEEQASYVTEFGFKKGSASLSEGAKSEIKRVLSQAQNGGKIAEVKVITWGDVEYPSTHTKKLSNKELDLVDNRNRAIGDYVKTITDASFDSHSMAQRPGVLREMFNTSDARVKRSLEVAGVPNTDTASKTPSKASRSILMVIRE